MGRTLEYGANGAAVLVAGEGRKWSGLRAVIRLARYRFFLLAGLFPYLLGAAVAYHSTGTIDWWLLVVGLAGVAFVSVGIEGTNEHFDSVIGGDRVFASVKRVAAPWHKYLALIGFMLALAVALYLATLRGWQVLCFAFAGGVAALSYLVPPIHLSYRGFGELVIAASYGAGLTLGSFCLQAGQGLWKCVAVSVLPGLLAFAMALANEVPDFYGDRLVGKRNLIVRLGQQRGAYLYAAVTGLFFAVMIIGLLVGIFRPFLWAALLLAPLAWRNIRIAVRSYGTPHKFFPVIRGTIIMYLLTTIIAIISYVWE